MTIPRERTQAIFSAREFLLDLLDPAKTPKVPMIVRQRARVVLRHYPNTYDIFIGERQFDWTMKPSSIRKSRAK